MRAMIKKITQVPTKFSAEGEVKDPAACDLVFTVDLSAEGEREAVKRLVDALEEGTVEVYVQVLPSHYNRAASGKPFFVGGEEMVRRGEYQQLMKVPEPDQSIFAEGSRVPRGAPSAAPKGNRAPRAVPSLHTDKNE